MAKNLTGEKLLYELYKRADIGMGNLRDSSNPTKDIENYLKKLESVTKKAKNNNRESLLKHFYYEKYVIREEDVPESYYELQKKIAFEQGYGNVNYTESKKHEEAKNIINEQKNSLDRILNYFSSEDAMYPMWAKVWAFQGIVRMGKFDKEKNKFTKRNKNTVTPFIELNQEVLAKAIDFMVSSIDENYLNDEAIINKLVEQGSFQKLYEHLYVEMLHKKTKFDATETNGKWIKYDRGGDHIPLVNSLEGKGTGWCTAGASTAKTQLSGGDFYVYYTADENGEYTNPRVAIRMDNNKIAEIKGIAANQNLESEMNGVVEEILNDFGEISKNEYLKKVNDMKQLTRIYNDQDNLTFNDLVFLYELESYILGFGYCKDPRIEEIINKRNVIDDYNFILDNCEIAKRLSCFSKLKLQDLKSVKGLKIPKDLQGDLNLSGLKTAEDLVLPESYQGILNLSGLETANDLVLPESYQGKLYLSGLKTAKGLVLPESYQGDLDLSGLETAKGLVLPESYQGYLNLSGLETAKGLVLPEGYQGDLYLYGLKTAEGLILPEGYRGYLTLKALKTVEDLVLPKGYQGDLELFGLKTAKGLVLPEGYQGSLYLYGLETAESLILPEGYSGNLYLFGLRFAEGLVLPEGYRGTLEFNDKTNFKNFYIPNDFNPELIIIGYDYLSVDEFVELVASHNREATYNNFMKNCNM